MHYTVFTKKKLKGEGRLGEGGGVRDGIGGKKRGVCHSVKGTLERVFPRPPIAKSWRCPCQTLICSHRYQKIDKYVTITRRGYNGARVIVGLNTSHDVSTAVRCHERAFIPLKQ